MFENFPYTDMHQLNLDWIVKIVKDFLDQYTTIEQIINDGTTSLTNLAEHLTTLLQEWYDTHSEDIAQELANALTDIAHSLDAALTSFNTQADAKAQETIASIPSDYTALSETVDRLDNLVTIHRLSWQVNRFLAFGDYTEDITSEAVLVTNDGFYQDGEHITSIPDTHYYKLDVSKYDDVYIDRITPAWYDVYTLLDENNVVVQYQYNDTSISTVQDIITLNTKNAKWLLLSDDAHNHMFKLMASPAPTISYAYTNNITINGINSERFITSETGKMYADGVLQNVSTQFRYVEYNVMGLRYIKLCTRTQGWEDIYDLIDKDGNVIAHEMVQQTGNYERIIYVQNAATIRISILGIDMDKIRIFSRNQYNNNPYSGNKIAIMGDSWVEYNNTNTENFMDLICRDMGIEMHNFAVSGAGYKATENVGTAFYQTAQTADFTGCNIALIFGSGNENTNIASGLLGLYTDNTTDTVCGCVNITIDRLLTRYPLIKIGIIAPGAWDSFPYTNENNNMAKLTSALKQICKYRGIPFLNLYEDGNLRPWDNTFANTYQPDGCHPNNAGHKFFYKTVEEFVKKLVQ